jgi:hypothetical protein
VSNDNEPKEWWDWEAIRAIYEDSGPGEIDESHRQAVRALVMEYKLTKERLKIALARAESAEVFQKASERGFAELDKKLHIEREKSERLEGELGDCGNAVMREGNKVLRHQDAIKALEAKASALEAKLKFAETFIKHNSGTTLDDWIASDKEQREIDERLEKLK